MWSLIDSNPKTQDQLQSLFAEVEDPVERAALEKTWKDDTSTLLECAQFLKDQQQCSELI